MDEYVRRVRMRAYLIWEREGRPEGKELEHWLAAEREISKEQDAAGLRAGMAYDRDLQQFEKTGRVEKAAKEAERALNGSEREDLEEAQEIGRRAGKREDSPRKL
jgi:general stress protein YciG